MDTTEQTAPYRASSAEQYARIMAHFDLGKKVALLGYGRMTVFTTKNRTQFFLSGNDLMLRRGKQAVCLNLTPIKFEKI